MINRSGMGELVAALMEAGGPLNLFLSQLLYAGQPFLRGLMPEERLEALAGLFEDQEESRSFAAFIREEIPG